MQWYKVGGEYGPQAGMYHELYVYTSSSSKAVEMFARRMKRDYMPHWERMGYRNVSCDEI